MKKKEKVKISREEFVKRFEDTMSSYEKTGNYGKMLMAQIEDTLRLAWGKKLDGVIPDNIVFAIAVAIGHLTVTNWAILQLPQGIPWPKPENVKEEILTHGATWLSKDMSLSLDEAKTLLNGPLSEHFLLEKKAA